MARIFSKFGKLIQKAFDEESPEPKGASQQQTTPTTESAPAPTPQQGEALPSDGVQNTPLEQTQEPIPVPQDMGTQQTIQDQANYDVDPDSLKGRQQPRRNINLDFFADEETKKVIDFYNKEQGIADETADWRQTVSHKETLGKAPKADGLTDEERVARIKKITNSDVNARWKPEDLVGVYQMLDTQGKELHSYSVELNKLIEDGGELSSEQLANYKLMETRYIATMEIASQRAADAGRMLNALKALGTTGTREYARDIENIVKGSGGNQTLKEKIKQMSKRDPNKPEDIGAQARGTWGAKTWDALMKIRYNAMLSSVKTHLVNIGGGIATAFWETVPVNIAKTINSNVEYGLKYAINKTFGRELPAQESRRMWSEAWNLPKATFKASKEAIFKAKDVFMGHEQGYGKVYNEMGIRVDRTYDTEKGSVVGQVLTSPTRLLEAEDAFFRSMHTTAYINNEAFKRANAQSKNEDEITEIMDAIIADPPDDLKAESLAYADKLTFTNDPSYYGEIMRGLAKVGSAAQDTKLGRLILPFVKTPVNVTGYTLEQTGLDLFVSPVRKFKEILTGTPEERADAIARIEIASGLLYYLYDHIEDGDITGAEPSNYNLYRSRQAGGWQSNAIRVGDEYYQLNRTDPFGAVLGVAATGLDFLRNSTEEDEATAVAATIVTIASMMTDRSMLAGLNDLERVFKSSETSVGKQAGKWTARQLTSFITIGPLRDIRSANDPYARSIDVPNDYLGAVQTAFVKALKNATPGWSDDLPPQVDALGYDIKNEGSSLYRGTIPINKRKIVQDPAVAALVATKTPVNKPDPEIKLGSNVLPINVLALDDYQGWAYRQYQIFVGDERQRAINEVIKDPIFQDALDRNDFGPQSEAAQAIAKAVTLGKKAGQVKFFEWIQGKDEFEPMIAGESIGKKIKLNRIDSDTLEQLSIMAAEQGPTPEVKEAIEKEKVLNYRFKADQWGTPKEMQVPSKQQQMPRF